MVVLPPLSLWISFPVRKKPVFPSLCYVSEMSRCMRFRVSPEQPFCLQLRLWINAHSKLPYARETLLSQPITEVSSDLMRSQLCMAVVLIKKHYWNIWPFFSYSVMSESAMTSLPFHAWVYYSYQVKNDSVIILAPFSNCIFSIRLIFHKAVKSVVVMCICK